MNKHPIIDAFDASPEIIMSLAALKTEVWKKVKGNEDIAKGNHHYEDIRKAILRETGHRISKDTIRNFLESRHDPQPKVLDIYATFVLGGDKENPKTYQDFENWIHGKSLYVKFLEFLKVERLRGAIILSLLLLVVALISIVLYRQDPKTSSSIDTSKAQQSNQKVTEPFTYSFENPNLPLLLEDGWFLFGDKKNAELWAAHNRYRTKYITLPTLPGDSWVENRDYKPEVINILAHSISCGNCCEISVKIRDFNPYQRYQQAGFFLYFSGQEIPSLRYTFASGGGNNHVAVVLRDGKFQNRHLIPRSQYQKRAIISQIIIEPETNVPEPETIIDSIILKIVFEDEHFFYAYKTDDCDFIPVSSNKLEVGTPLYIGLAAFQGRPDVPYPILPMADTIEAKFEYVEVVPCK